MERSIVRVMQKLCSQVLESEKQIKYLNAQRNELIHTLEKISVQLGRAERENRSLRPLKEQLERAYELLRPRCSKLEHGTECECPKREVIGELLLGQRLRAILAYRKQTGLSPADAKATIDRYILNLSSIPRASDSAK